MLKGKMRHRDSSGNAGLLEDGAVQWMTAGRGILHSEMPEQSDGSLWGFQIWLNLPQRIQMSEPRYQDIPATDITEFTQDDVAYRLVSGELSGHVGPAKTHLPVLMVDIELTSGTATIPLTDGDTAILFCFEGKLSIEGQTVEDGDLAVIEGVGGVTLKGSGRGLLISSAPLNEPIARHGPFVLSTEDELKMAFSDYQTGQLAPNQAEFLATGGLG
jgi:redox-sensitive bicupin YhaK (pirin superfamily)